MKILGIVPALPKPHYLSRYKIPVVGLPILLTIAKKMGHQTEILMGEVLSINVNDLLTRAERADLIALSCLSATFPQAEYYARLIKSKWPNKLIVIGGPHVTFKPEDGLRCADFVIRYEGEFGFPSLLGAIALGNGFENAPNLSWKNNGRITHNPLKTELPDLDRDSPFPDFDQIVGWKNPPIVAIEASRGCEFGQCEFCCVCKMFPGIRFRDPETVVAEIAKQNPRSIFFPDDNFAADPEHSIAILALMLRKLKRIPPWAAQVRASIGENREWLRLAKRTGCVFLCVGFESRTQASLKEAKKGQSLESVERAIAGFKEEGMLHAVHGAFVVGFDGDDKYAGVESAKWARKTGLGSIQISVLTPLPGTDTCAKLKAQGRILSENPGDLDGTKVTFRPTGMTIEELQRSAVDGLKKFSSPWVITKFFFKAIVRAGRDYLERVANLRPIFRHFHEPAIKIYIRSLAAKIGRKTRRFSAAAKK